MNKPSKSSFKNFDFKGNRVITQCFEKLNIFFLKKNQAQVKFYFTFKGILVI